MSTAPGLPTTRTAQEVISAAIAENRGAERLCYGLVVAFVGAGLFTLVYGALKGEGLVALAGSVASGLFWPALASARRIHEQNLMIRLLEVPLSKETTAEGAARALQETFLAIFETQLQKSARSAKK